jgi:hypothetical protein
LNDEQILTPNKPASAGWKPEFIRKPLFQGVAPVLLHPDRNTAGALEADGTLILQADLEIRNNEQIQSTLHR